MVTRCNAVVLAGILVAVPFKANPQTSNTTEAKPEATAPILRNSCLITKDVARLVEFYSRVLERPAKTTGNDYAEFHTGAGVLAIFSAAAQEKYIPGSAQAASNNSVILEFEVANVDEQYKRLHDVVKNWVRPPTTQPWGTRSLYFRDPDGNLVDFYSWVERK